MHEGVISSKCHGNAQKLWPVMDTSRWQFAFVVEPEWKREREGRRGLSGTRSPRTSGWGSGILFERNGKSLEGGWSQNSFQLLDSSNFLQWFGNGKKSIKLKMPTRPNWLLLNKVNLGSSFFIKLPVVLLWKKLILLSWPHLIGLTIKLWAKQSQPWISLTQWRRILGNSMWNLSQFGPYRSPNLRSNGEAQWSFEVLWPFLAILMNLTNTKAILWTWTALAISQVLFNLVPFVSR